jgi:hypothetical protein
MKQFYICQDKKFYTKIIRFTDFSMNNNNKPNDNNSNNNN